MIPGTQAEVKSLVEEYGDVVIGDVTVKQVVGGARGIKSMLWLGSNLDANEVGVLVLVLVDVFSPLVLCVLPWPRVPLGVGVLPSAWRVCSLSCSSPPHQRDPFFSSFLVFVFCFGLVWFWPSPPSAQGIRFRGHSLPDVQEHFPGDGEPRPESLLWLLLTGDIPTLEQEAAVTAELHSRAELPAGVEEMINALPKDMHPMTKLSTAVLYLQQDSVFHDGYAKGVPKNILWQYTYEDIMNLIARMPRVAALIYRNTFHDGKIADYDSSLDYSANFARMLGFDDADFDELMRLYLTIHTDHEGGNASAHTAHLVASTLSDPYLAMSGALCSLAGPLHGLANQEVLRWVKNLQTTFHERNLPITHETIRDFTWETLNAGKVVPGFGHAVLRITDPRYTCQREFAMKHMEGDELVDIVRNCYEVIPDVLTEHGKTANPFPNVDAHSGVLLVHFGLTEENYYTVLFGVSRTIGCAAQMFWDRALGLPLERPKSLTIEGLRDAAIAAAAEN